MIKVYFERENRMVEVPPGETLLNAARKAGVEVHRHVDGDHRCYASEPCTTCAVQVKLGANALSPRTSLEKATPKGLRLACQARLFTDAVVATLDEIRFIPDTAAPSWGLFGGTESGVALSTVPGLARA